MSEEKAIENIAEFNNSWHLERALIYKNDKIINRNRLFLLSEDNFFANIEMLYNIQNKLKKLIKESDEKMLSSLVEISDLLMRIPFKYFQEHLDESKSEFLSKLPRLSNYIKINSDLISNEVMKELGANIEAIINEWLSILLKKVEYISTDGSIMTFTNHNSKLTKDLEDRANARELLNAKIRVFESATLHLEQISQEELEKKPESEDIKEKMKEIWKQVIQESKDSFKKVQDELLGYGELEENESKLTCINDLAKIVKNYKQEKKPIEFKFIDSIEQFYDKVTFIDKIDVYMLKLEQCGKIYIEKNNNLLILSLLVDFYNYFNAGCGPYIKDYIKGQLGDAIINALKEIRNKAVHCIDDIATLEELVKQSLNISGIKSEFKKILETLKENFNQENNEKLNDIKMDSKTSRYLFAVQSLIPDPLIQTQKHGRNNKSTYIKEEKQLSKSSKERITIDQEIKFFKSSIANSKKLLNIIKTELHKDNMTDIQIIRLLKTDDILLKDDIKNLRMKIKYDLLLQALGQSLGNLREYENMPEIAKLNIKFFEQNFEFLPELIISTKEYRSLRAHTTDYNSYFTEKIFEILPKESDQVINELDILFALIAQEIEIIHKGIFDSLYHDRTINLETIVRYDRNSQEIEYAKSHLRNQASVSTQKIINPIIDNPYRIKIKFIQPTNCIII